MRCSRRWWSAAPACLGSLHRQVGNYAPRRRSRAPSLDKEPIFLRLSTALPPLLGCCLHSLSPHPAAPLAWRDVYRPRTGSRLTFRMEKVSRDAVNEKRHPRLQMFMGNTSSWRQYVGNTRRPRISSLTNRNGFLFRKLNIYLISYESTHRKAKPTATPFIDGAAVMAIKVSVLTETAEICQDVFWVEHLTSPLATVGLHQPSLIHKFQ